MANILDKITDTRNATRPVSTTASGTRAAGGTSLACNSLTGWPTASKVHFVTYQIDTNSHPVAGTQLDCSGIVSGNTIGSFTVLDGTDTGNSVGDVVEMLPTASWGQDLSDAFLALHDRTGQLTAAALTSISSSVLQTLHPVGSLYTSTLATNPGTLLGFGTWSAYAAGRVLVGVGSSDQAFAAAATGGESNHTLSTAEMPSHNHTQDSHNHTQDAHNHASVNGNAFKVNTSGWPTTGGVGSPFTNDAASIVTGSTTATNQATTATNQATGGGGTHNNLQPYVVVYMWTRTS